jgi:hypothetical protein
VLAAVGAARAAPEAAPAGEVADAPETLRFTALRGRALRAGLLGTGRLATKPGPVAGAVRGMMVAPWFAAATGFVVAAGLWIYSPHAELKFPPSAGGVVRCGTNGCGAVPGQGGGALTTTTPQPIQHSAATQVEGAHSLATAGLTFSYSVLDSHSGKFAVLITVTGRRLPHTWKLSFTLPSDQISAVFGANWHPSGSDGGTASGPVAAVSGQDPWPVAGGSSVEGSQALGVSRHAIRILVLGAGTPVAPGSCSFKASPCSFSYISRS